MPGARRVLAVRIGCVLMASGFSRRFGGNKLLTEAEGVPLVRRAFAALPAELFDRAAVTSRYPEILDAAREAGYLALENPEAGEGIAAGIRLGLAEMGETDGLLFAVCDQPWLRRESVERLLCAFRDAPERIAALSWQGERGNPVIFPRRFFSELASLRGDTGGGAVIRRHPEGLLLVEACGAEELRDVDRPGDLAKPDQG